MARDERRLQVGLNVPIWVDPGGDPVAEAREAERLGFDFVSVNDHLHGAGARYETWTLMSWMAAATSRIGIASRVLAVPYRNPAVLAKMAETFDRLSTGRLVLGLGAGASEEEFGAYGIAPAPLRDRISGLEETILILKGLWSGTPFTFAGAHHRTDAAIADPAPARPIPIWLGAYGPRGLAMLGRRADGWIASIELATPERAPGMIERIRRAADAAGRDPDGLTLVYNLEVSLEPPDDIGSLAAGGTPEEIAAALLGYTELGFGAFNLIVVGPDRSGQTQRLAEEVLPVLRTASATR